MNSIAMGPRTASMHSESLLAVITAIWERVLERSNIGVEDDFFELGGNSMLLVAMIDVLQQRLKKDVDIAQLADGITIRRFAALLA
jgi:hypothetical protein